MEGIPEITPFRDRLKEIDTQMAEPDFFSDQRRAASLSREHQKLSQLIETYEKLETAHRDLEEHRALLADDSADPDLKELAGEEISALEELEHKLQENVLVLMIPPEPSDDRNIVVEIRGGAGGDEANIFAGDLYRMYVRCAENRGWSVEVMNTSESEAGGFKEVIFLMKGEEAYKQLKYESGVHRVQRVPATESQGRIHTSTATVAVLPEAQEVDIHIDPAELDISVARASGPGGQGVNTTDSAVQIIHKPTGIIVKCADERSQLKNKTKAMSVLRARLLQAKEEEERAKYAENRRSQVGTGDRSERIRTYNFPQSRITDHRIGYTAHNLDEVMDGGLDDLISALQKSDYEGRIEALLESHSPGAGAGGTA
jgi:peptide chain release factor 1